jgi:NDP-sugar pyrophosphorylase family protein
MIFAAGRGTRLGALGERSPKALIEIAGLTMLERTVRSLVAAGARRIVVNVHHHADRIERFVTGCDLGAEILLSREPERPLETGGGLLHARDLFHRDAPILLHNVDVICRADLRGLVEAHSRSGALAMLAVNERETSRTLLFDDLGLVGREDRRCAQRREVRPPQGTVRALAFAGVQVCAPAILDLIEEQGRALAARQRRLDGDRESRQTRGRAATVGGKPHALTGGAESIAPCDMVGR